MPAAAPSRGTLEPVVVPSASFLNSAKVFNPKGCTMEIDTTLDAMVLVMKGDVSTTRVQLPSEDRPLSALRLRYCLATLQVRLNNTDHFALELTVGQNAVQRTKVIIGTHVKEPKQDLMLAGMPTVRLPLVIPRNRWVQVVFHVAGILSSIFGLTAMQSIDAVALCGAAKIGTLNVSNSEQACIDSSPEGLALFAVPAYAPPVWVTAASAPGVGEAPTAAAADHRSRVPSPGKNAANGSPRSPMADMDIDCHGRSLALAEPAAHTPAALRGGSHPLVPARLDPLDDSLAAVKSAHRAVGATDAGGAPTAQRPGSARLPSSASPTPPAVETGWASPSPSPLTERVVAAVAAQRVVQPSYVRLISVAAERPGPSARTVSSYAYGRRAETAPAPTAAAADGGWFDGVERWEPTDTASPPRPGQKPSARDKAEGKPSKVSPARPKVKMTPQAERLQRIVAARKLQYGSVAARGSDDAGSPSGAATQHRGKKRRARRRMQIIRANEKQASKMAVAKALVPSEIPILRPAAAKTDTGVPASATGTASDSAAAASSEPDPKCGYGFGYMGILHENGDYEEADGAELKGAWSLAISDDDE